MFIKVYNIDNLIQTMLYTNIIILGDRDNHNLDGSVKNIQYAINISAERIISSYVKQCN